jgi:hypothetical protein
MNDSSSSRGGLSIREGLSPRQASADPSGSGESLYHAALAPGSTVFGRLETTRGVKMLRILNQRLVACEDRLSDFLRKEVPARLASLILDFSEHQGVVTAKGGRMIPTRYTSSWRAW